MSKRKIAVFDFDGTLTTKDTLLEFIKYACGVGNFYIGFLLHSPLLVLMKLHLYPNWKAKEKVFFYFFKGWEYKKFQELGNRFADLIDTFKRDDIVGQLSMHVKNGDTVYVISASIEDWVKPWCQRNQVSMVLGTKIEVDEHGKITGKFSTENCYGQAKVNRLLHIEPRREEYVLYAYGDSRGDKEMLEFADHGVLI